MSEKNTSSILEAIKRKLHKFDKKTENNEQPTLVDDEFHYIPSDKKKSLVEPLSIEIEKAPQDFKNNDDLVFSEFDLDSEEEVSQNNQSVKPQEISLDSLEKDQDDDFVTSADDNNSVQNNSSQIQENSEEDLEFLKDLESETSENSSPKLETPDWLENIKQDQAVKEPASSNSVSNAPNSTESFAEEDDFLQSEVVENQQENDSDFEEEIDFDDLDEELKNELEAELQKTSSNSENKNSDSNSENLSSDVDDIFADIDLEQENQQPKNNSQQVSVDDLDADFLADDLNETNQVQTQNQTNEIQDEELELEDLQLDDLDHEESQNASEEKLESFDISETSSESEKNSFEDDLADLDESDIFIQDSAENIVETSQNDQENSQQNSVKHDDELSFDDFEESAAKPFSSDFNQQIEEDSHDEIIEDVSPERLTSQLDQVAQNERNQQLSEDLEREMMGLESVISDVVSENKNSEFENNNKEKSAMDDHDFLMQDPANIAASDNNISENLNAKLQNSAPNFNKISYFEESKNLKPQVAQDNFMVAEGNNSAFNPRMLQESTVLQVQDSMKKLLDAKNVVAGVSNFAQSPALAELAAQLLEPKIDKWFNDNLPQLVEKIVREEIKKLIPKE